MLNQDNVLKTGQIRWVKPYQIVQKNNGQNTYEKNYKEKEIEDAVNWIHFYKGMKDSGISDKEIFDVKPISKAYDIFFRDMIKVAEKEGKYILMGEGDIRIKIAMNCRHASNIPVLVICRS